MASTHRDHVVLCGLGHLGFRVLEQLLASHTPVVVVEKNADGRFMAAGKSLGVPILVRDMKNDQSLIDAGVPSARAIIIATNDDMANLEVALDSRRMNPKIRVIMRLFDQQIAQKISGAFMVDAAFSASALAAPMVAAMSLETRVLASFLIGDVPYLACEIAIEPGSSLAGRTIAQLEEQYAARILARTPRGGAPQSPPALTDTTTARDVLVVHLAADRSTSLAAAARPAGRSA